MGLRTKVFILIPLIIFGGIVFGFGMYNTICKNAHINLLDC